MKTAAVITLVFFAALSGLLAGELGIDINGFAYHYNAKTFYDKNGRERDLNGVNKGLGVQYITSETDKTILVLEAGFYEDSLYNTAKYAAYEYKHKFNRSLSAGAGLILFDTPSYLTNVGVLPVVSYRIRGIPYLRDIAFNLTWLPDVYNIGTSDDKSALALYFTSFPFTKGTLLNK